MGSWLYSSLSAAAQVIEHGSALQIERHRMSVSPQGHESTSIDRVRLELVSPDILEAEAVAVGLRPTPRRAIPATEHVACVVVVASRVDGT